MSEKMKQKYLVPAVLAGTVTLGQGAAAQEIVRGPNIAPIAGNCFIGPFPQTNKAGIYNRYCDELSNAEKCLAFIKGRFWSDGQTSPVSSERESEKLSFCLEQLKQDLAIETLVEPSE